MSCQRSTSSCLPVPLLKPGRDRPFPPSWHFGRFTSRPSQNLEVQRKVIEVNIRIKSKGCNGLAWTWYLILTQISHQHCFKRFEGCCGKDGGISAPLYVHRTMCPSAQTDVHSMNWGSFSKIRRKGYIFLIKLDIWILNKFKLFILLKNVCHSSDYFFFILREILNVPRHWVRLMFEVLCEQALQEPFGGAEAREFWSQASKRTPYMVRSGKMVQCWDSDGQQHIGIWRTLTLWPRSALIAGLAHPLPLGIRVTCRV